MTDVVLVHGAFHGGWCWAEVANLLAAEGHRVLRPTLTGLADRRHLLHASVDLQTHIDDIVETIRYEELDDVVLVCHSVGGVPGIGAADRIAAKIGALVLLDAMIPIDGMSSSEVRDRSTASWPMDLSGPTVTPPSSAVFGIPADRRAHIDRLLTPQPVGTLVQPISLTGAFETIEVRQYHRFVGYEAAYMDESASRAASAGWTVRRHRCAHDMMLIDPAWTASLILAAVRDTAPTATP